MSDYRTGRGKPPKAWQFKEGQSGNPGGRPKKHTGVDVISILDEPVAVMQNGKTRELSPSELTMRHMVKRALKNEDFGAMKYLIEQFEKYDALLIAETEQSSGVLSLPSSMPWTMAIEMAMQFGVPPWSDADLAVGRAAYIAQRSEEDRKIDEAIGYPDL